jgi:energy-coupling factor transporter transmembrane protein EcfT
MTMTIALKFVPLLITELERLMRAQSPAVCGSIKAA